MAWNSYRKRHYNISDSKRRSYANQMQEIEEYFIENDDWDISSRLDSAYRSYNDYTVRLSNHSADNQYHDIHNGRLLINVKSSKLDFIRRIENEVDKIVEYVDTLELEKYRYIHVNGSFLKAYLKGYKTNFEEFKWEE